MRLYFDTHCTCFVNFRQCREKKIISHYTVGEQTPSQWQCEYKMVRFIAVEQKLTLVYVIFWKMELNLEIQCSMIHAVHIKIMIIILKCTWVACVICYFIFFYIYTSTCMYMNSNIAYISVLTVIMIVYSYIPLGSDQEMLNIYT